MKKCLSDCNYNCIKQLTKKLSFLWHVNHYIKDAEKWGHEECLKTFKKIRDDEKKHAEMLRG